MKSSVPVTARRHARAVEPTRGLSRRSLDARDSHAPRGVRATRRRSVSRRRTPRMRASPELPPRRREKKKKKKDGVPGVGCAWCAGFPGCESVVRGVPGVEKCGATPNPRSTGVKKCGADSKPEIDFDRGVVHHTDLEKSALIQALVWCERLWGSVRFAPHPGFAVPQKP